jgi:hypothetical protein
LLVCKRLFVQIWWIATWSVVSIGQWERLQTSGQRSSGPDRGVRNASGVHCLEEFLFTFFDDFGIIIKFWENPQKALFDSQEKSIFSIYIYMGNYFLVNLFKGDFPLYL